jgi:hypothetical protein
MQRRDLYEQQRRRELMLEGRDNTVFLPHDSWTEQL